jgi:hypothetical protein
MCVFMCVHSTHSHKKCQGAGCVCVCSQQTVFKKNCARRLTHNLKKTYAQRHRHRRKHRYTHRYTHTHTHTHINTLMESTFLGAAKFTTTMSITGFGAFPLYPPPHRNTHTRLTTLMDTTFFGTVIDFPSTCEVFLDEVFFCACLCPP